MTLPQKLLAATSAVLMLLAGCAPSATQTPVAPTTSETRPAATEVRPTTEPTAAPTQPPTLVPSSLPTATPEPAGPSIAEIVAGLQDLPIDEFFEASYRQLQLRDPDRLISLGVDADYNILYDRFSDRSDAYVRQTQQLEVAVLELLRSYERESLPPDQQLSYDIYEWYLDDLVRGHAFMYYDSPVNGYGSWDAVNQMVELMVYALPVVDLQSAENYVARLSQIEPWVDQLLEGLQLREQAGAIPPRFLLEQATSQLEAHLQMQGPNSFDLEAIELYTSLRDRILPSSSINPADGEALLEAARDVIEQSCIPALLRLREYLMELEGLASDEAGLWRLPEGDAYYASILRRYTGADVTADELHEMGVAQVARLQAEIRQVAAELGYAADISLPEINQILSEQAGTLEGTALLAEYERLIAAAEQAADGFFDLWPTAEVVVRYDRSAPPAFYEEPPGDGSGPGAMVTNLQPPERFSLYNRHVLVHHETIPGHHVQLALTLDLDLPAFRSLATADVYFGKEIAFQGYVEGWAMYAQQLGWEMGLYEGDQLENLGRLRLMLHQMARMVVDTGIHARGWTREEAAAYLTEATGVPASVAQMNRYVAVPGQAICYSYGMLTILDLRHRAMDQLGEAFDIRQFHNVILGNGPMPVGFLERVVEQWIEAARAP